jgi:hypothetical protein
LKRQERHQKIPAHIQEATIPLREPVRCKRQDNDQHEGRQTQEAAEQGAQ